MNNTVVSAIGFVILAIIGLLNYGQIAAANQKLDQLEELLEQSPNPAVFCDELEGLQVGSQDQTSEAKLNALIEKYCR